jgi:hypothetical protein
MVALKVSPSASPAGAWQCDARDSLYEGGFPCALPTDNGDGRNIQVYVGSTTWINDLWQGTWVEVRTQARALE